MQHLFIVTNTHKSQAKKEDNLLAYVCNAFVPTHMVDVREVLDTPVDSSACYLFRNTWGDASVQTRLRAAYTRFDAEHMMYLNRFEGKGDQQGKHYLLELCASGASVIPTHTIPEEALKHSAKQFLLKPIFGESGEGIISLSRDKLQKISYTNGSLIQPKLPFACELSFFFLDQTFVYALRTRFHRWDLVRYEPRASEIEHAKSFIAWNPVRGIQRVDFLQQHDGNLLLLELEDWCPYLSLFDVRGLDVDGFVKSLIASMESLTSEMPQL